MNGAPARDADTALATASDITRRVTRDLSELRSILDRAGSEEEADFVGEIAGELEEFELHLARLKEKRAEWQSRTPTSLSTVTSTPRFSE